MSTEQLSIHLLPAMIEKFTVNPTTIAVILFINPAFGFIAQPIVGVLGDKIWTPVGRRAFFLITGAPIVAICLWFVPRSPIPLASRCNRRGVSVLPGCSMGIRSSATR